jgi:hypothetical protein
MACVLGSESCRKWSLLFLGRPAIVSAMCLSSAEVRTYPGHVCRPGGPSDRLGPALVKEAP